VKERGTFGYVDGVLTSARRLAHARVVPGHMIGLRPEALPTVAALSDVMRDA
jgi:hypothetical protein